MQSFSDTLTKIEETMVNMVAHITGTQSNLDQFKQQMTSSLSTAEGTLSTSLNNLTQRVNQTEAMIQQMQNSASNMNGARSGSSGAGSTNFVPWKHLTPTKFGNKVEVWREWQEDVRGYFDGTKPGIKEVLQALENEEEEQGDDFVVQRYSQMAHEGPALWRALKNLTEVGSDARRIVTGVPDEDGFWLGRNCTSSMDCNCRRNKALSVHNSTPWPRRRKPHQKFGLAS